MYKLDYECKKGRDVKPFAIPNKLLLGAGPSNCSLRVLRALSQPGLNTISPEIYVVSVWKSVKIVQIVQINGRFFLVLFADDGRD